MGTHLRTCLPFRHPTINISVATKPCLFSVFILQRSFTFLSSCEHSQAMWHGPFSSFGVSRLGRCQPRGSARGGRARSVPTATCIHMAFQSSLRTVVALIRKADLMLLKRDEAKGLWVMDGAAVDIVYCDGITDEIIILIVLVLQCSRL